MYYFNFFLSNSLFMFFLSEYRCVILKSFFELKIYYQNTRGLQSKCHNFYRQVACENYDVIILTETWLSGSVMSSELVDSRNIIYRRDRYNGQKSGEVFWGLRINSKRMSQWVNCKDLWAIVYVAIAKSVYRVALWAVNMPPPVLCLGLEHYLNSSNRIFEQSKLSSCIVGDVNISFESNLVSESNREYSTPG